AAHRAAASVTGSDGAAWLDGLAAQGMTCDASVIPVVTGELDVTALDDLVRLCVQLDRLDHQPGQPQPGQPQAPAQPGPAAEPGGQAREMLQHAIISRAVDLVSGPGGLASFLRTRQLGARLAGPSLPLDVGRSADIPAAIRRAVILRDQHCRWAGGCDQPAAACEVHHLTHQADGGPTSVWDCALFCWFHHHVVIHQWGWIVTLHPDGTTTARSPDGTKIFRSHGPPARPG
ncbi:MAG TPA: HNH endonuclease signature motif containing protein, partial [Streptosporangiaceae bacterium]